jgi:hypothetical protein
MSNETLAEVRGQPIKQAFTEGMPTTPTPSNTHQHVSYGGEDGGGLWCLHCPQMSVLCLGVCIALAAVPNKHGGEVGRSLWVSASPLGVCLIIGTQGPLGPP